MIFRATGPDSRIRRLEDAIPALSLSYYTHQASLREGKNNLLYSVKKKKILPETQGTNDIMPKHSDASWYLHFFYKYLLNTCDLPDITLNAVFLALPL